MPQAVPELAAYDTPEVASASTRDAGGHAREAALMLEGITCAACVWLIEQRMAVVPGANPPVGPTRVRRRTYKSSAPHIQKKVRALWPDGYCKGI